MLFIFHVFILNFQMKFLQNYKQIHYFQDNFSLFYHFFVWVFFKFFKFLIVFFQESTSKLIHDTNSSGALPVRVVKLYIKVFSFLSSSILLASCTLFQ